MESYQLTDWQMAPQQNYVVLVSIMHCQVFIYSDLLTLSQVAFQILYKLLILMDIINIYYVTFYLPQCVHCPHCHSLPNGNASARRHMHSLAGVLHQHMDVLVPICHSRSLNMVSI